MTCASQSRSRCDVDSVRCSLRAISPRPRQKLGLETDVIAAGQSGLWTGSVIVGWCNVGATSEAAWDLPRFAKGAVTPHIADALWHARPTEERVALTTVTHATWIPSLTLGH